MTDARNAKKDHVEDDSDAEARDPKARSARNQDAEKLKVAEKRTYGYTVPSRIKRTEFGLRISPEDYNKLLDAWGVPNRTRDFDEDAKCVIIFEKGIPEVHYVGGGSARLEPTGWGEVHDDFDDFVAEVLEILTEKKEGQPLPPSARKPSDRKELLKKN